MVKKTKKKNDFSNMKNILTALNNETINNIQMDDKFVESFIPYMYLASGEIKTLKQLEEEGKSVEVFCVNDKNGKLERGIAHSFRITKYVNELHHIKLYNGEEIVCTENHPFLMNNLQWKRADEIKRFDSFYNYVIRDINGKPSCKNMKTNEYTELNRIGLDKVKDENLVKAKEENDKLYKALIKAFKILRELEEKELSLTLDNYNKLRDEASKKYHCPKIEKMIERGQISSFKNLVEIYNNFEFDYKKENKTSKQMKKNLKYTYIAFSKMVKYALDKGIEISRENCNEVFNMLSNEYRRKYGKDRKYGLGIPLEKLEINYNFEDVLNRFYHDNLIVKEVTIEKVDNAPVYDFTEDGNHNALLYLGELNNRLSMIATYNSVLNL